MNKKKVLVGSPIYQKPQILLEFLKSLKKLNRLNITIDYMFIDDNVDEISSQLLIDFQRKNSNVKIIRGKESGIYICNDESHNWNDNLMLKVANYKNSIIKHAIEYNYDYLFFVDSDLVLNSNIIEHLINTNKNIVSEIFWTKWHTNSDIEPNVWMFDEYDLIPKELGEKLSKEEMDIRKIKFLNKLKIPGLYEVGGLGACTLISRFALLEGVNFNPIKNLTIHGEDRFFCIRAAVLNLDLYIDTHYPAYHIYREKDLDGVKKYVDDNESTYSYVRKYKEKGNKITLSMIVKNESNRYLHQILSKLSDHIDEGVIIDDGSDDNTIDMCRELLKNIPLKIIQNDKSMFANESELRKKQWLETIETNPDWILNLDADEMIEDSFWNNAQEIINSKNCDAYYFRLFDMWNDTHYREDKYWNAHNTHKLFLLRYQPNFNYTWNEMSQHCGRFPQNIFAFKKHISNYRVKHLGWSKHSDRIEKYKRYQLLDPDAIYGIKEQYDSIMDTKPNLIRWEVIEGI